MTPDEAHNIIEEYDRLREACYHYMGMNSSKIVSDCNISIIPLVEMEELHLETLDEDNILAHGTVYTQLVQGFVSYDCVVPISELEKFLQK
jgi:hypothetical protein